jgi:hypothetical protein
MRQYLTVLSFKALALLFSIPSGGLNSCKKYKIYLYQGHAASGTTLWEPLLDDSACSLMKLIPKALQFDSASNLAKPFPFISLVGLISRSNSRILAIHLPLLPSMSGYMRISFTEAEGTYAMIFECKT